MKVLFKKLLLIVISVCLYFIVGNNLTVEAAETRGHITRISSNIYEENGEIVGVAKNEFTLGFSTVVVNVYLYSSTTNDQSLENWNLEASSQCSDLNMGESLYVTSIGKHGYYYKCYVVFVRDNSQPANVTSDYYYYS